MRVRVTGDSMLPTLEPGDRLLCLPAWRLRTGDLVAVRDPRDGGRLMVKRVTGVERAAVTVAGDNAAASTDSRAFGPVPRDLVVGRPAWRYFPESRAGRVR